MMKIRWTVAEAPTGPYKSFRRRGWPRAAFENGEYAAALYCDDDYVPRNVKVGKHGPITIKIARHDVKEEGRGLITATLKRRANTLAEAKQIVSEFYERNPKCAPHNPTDGG